MIEAKVSHEGQYAYDSSFPQPHRLIIPSEKRRDSYHMPTPWCPTNHGLSKTVLDSALTLV